MRTLRLFALMLSLVVIGSNLSHAGTRTIDIRKENGGEHGYDQVDEYHNETYSSLTCQNPGWSGCTFINTPQPRLVGYAEGQIANGVYSGTYSQVFGNLKCTVTWEATSTGNAHIVETQDEIGTMG